MARTFKDEIKTCFPKLNGHYAIPLNIDMDATLIYHGYDSDGDSFKVNGRAVEILKRWINDYNCYIIIFTTRDGDKLDEVIQFYNDNDIKFHAIYKNEQQEDWTNSSKSYGYMIDDLSAGIPVFYDDNDRATVDWDELEKVFEPRLIKIKNVIDEIEKEVI